MVIWAETLIKSDDVSGVRFEVASVLDGHPPDVLMRTIHHGEEHDEVHRHSAYFHREDDGQHELLFNPSDTKFANCVETAVI